MPGKLNALEWWHLLSLDAPTAATLWVMYVTRVSHSAAPWTLGPAMFLATWILYAADRLLDARTEAAGLQARHYFHGRHAAGFRVMLVMASLGLIPLLIEFPHALLFRYVVLGLLLTAWLLIVHSTRAKLPKEIAAGLFFSAAVFLPAGAEWAAAGALASLAMLNGFFIDAWECGTAWSGRWFNLRSVTLGVAVVASCLPMRRLGLPLAMTGMGLLALDRWGARWMGATTRRAAADAALLTPMFFLWVRQ